MLDNLPRGTICIEDIEMGMSRHLRKQVTDRDIELFAEVSTDHNPVHMDEDYARDTIFAGPHCTWNADGRFDFRRDRRTIARTRHSLHGPISEIPCPRAPR